MVDKQYIRVSASLLADFMTSSPARQREIVLRVKFPDPAARRFRGLYYRDARAAFKAAFMASEPRSALVEFAGRIVQGAVNASPHATHRAKENRRVIVELSKSPLAAAGFTPEPAPLVAVALHSLQVMVRPHLHLLDKRSGSHLWVHLDLRREMPPGTFPEILVHLLLTAAEQHDPAVCRHSAAYYHLHSGHRWVAHRPGKRLGAQIAAACATFADIWSRI